MKKWFAYGGIAASIVMIASGAGAISVGALGINEVRDKLAQEKITASADDPAAKELGIAGSKIDTGDEAKAFASMMREHTLAITDGRTYAEMGRFLDKNGEETSDAALAAKDPETGQPVANPVRDVWVTETALATALNQSFFAVARGRVLDRHGRGAAADGNRLPRAHAQRSTRSRPGALAQDETRISVGRDLSNTAALATGGRKPAR
jgi:hypothetical protein